MPIPVVCPACGAKLSTPDSAAGKQVRCPKAGCGTLVPVPAFLAVEEVEETPAVPPPPRPVRAAAVEDDDDDRPRRRRRDDEDEDADDRPRSRRRDDDEEDDDRPRRRRAAGRRRSGGGAGKVVAIVAGVVVLVGGVGAAVYFLAFGTASPPAGWKEYTYADAGFKAYFPVEPKRLGGGRGFGMVGEGGVGGESISLQAATTEDGVKIQTMIQATRLPPNVPADQVRDGVNKRFAEVSQSPQPGTRVSGSRSVSWMGYKAYELRLEPSDGAKVKTPNATAVTRCVVTDTHQIVAMIAAEDGGKLASRTINGFFDNIQPLK